MDRRRILLERSRIRPVLSGDGKLLHLGVAIATRTRAIQAAHYESRPAKRQVRRLEGYSQLYRGEERFQCRYGSIGGGIPRSEVVAADSRGASSCGHSGETPSYGQCCPAID